MISRLRYCIPALILCAAVAHGQQASQSLGSIVNRSEAAPAPTEDDGAVEIVPEDPIEAQLQAMTLDQKIAQLFIVPLQGGLAPNSNDRQFLRTFPPGGVILPPPTKPWNAITLVKAIRETKKSHGIPLLIGTNVFAPSDKERTMVDLFLRVPSMTAIAAAGDSTATSELFDLLAEDLFLMGFDFHLGPDLKLAATLRPTFALDNFGSDPRRTAELASALGNSMNSNNVMWVPSGFPGGGDNQRGNDPAVLLTPRGELFDNDLQPYRHAIQQGVRMIHVGNTLVPTIDSRSLPASQSAQVMTELLRQGLEFDGLVLAGPLDATDFSKDTDVARLVMRSLASGADMILLQESGIKALKTFAEVSIAIQEARFDVAHIDRAVRKIIALKADLNLQGKKLPEEKSAPRIEAQRDKNDASYTIERGSITLLRNRGNLLPLDKKMSNPVALTGIEGTEELESALEGHFKKIFRQGIVSAETAGSVQQFEFKRVLDLTGGARNVIYILTNAADMATQYQLLQQIKGQGKPLIVIALDYPKNPRVLEPADAVILAYRSNHTLQETLTAVSDVLMGNAPIQILDVQGELSGKVGQEIQFNVLDVIRSPIGRLPMQLSEALPAGYAAAYVPTLALKKVTWEFGDGKGSSASSVAHAYKQAGSYTARLTIKQDTGEPITGTFPIVIE